MKRDSESVLGRRRSTEDTEATRKARRKNGESKSLIIGIGCPSDMSVIRIPLRNKGARVTV